jgi:hypothetical protein
MRKALCVLLTIACLTTVCLAQADRGQSVPESLFGTWSGTWEGSGEGGGFELTLEKGKDGSPAGKVSVTGAPAYKADLKTLSFEGRKMTAKYDFTPDPAAEVILAATFVGNSASGTWSLVE